MQVYGFKTIKGDLGFKGLDADVAEKKKTEAELIEQYFEDAFGVPRPETAGYPKHSSNPIDDYTLGDIIDDTVTGDKDTNVAAWLKDFPVSVDQIMLRNKDAIVRHDILKRRYEKAEVDLKKLKAAYLAEMGSGEAPADRVEHLTYLTGLIDKAIDRTLREKKKLAELVQRMDKLHADEMARFIDLDGDGWVGEKFKGFYLKQNEDGTVTYFDPKTKRAVANPASYPGYTPKLTDTADSLERIEDTEALNKRATENIDLFLRLKPSALTSFSAENIYKTPIDLNIPSVLYVEKKEDGKYATQTNEEANNEEKMVLYNKWSTEGGLHQEIPTDLSRYMQVEIVGVKIYSVDSGVTDSKGNKLYHQVVEFKARDDMTIGKLRIEGFYDKAKSNLSAAAKTTTGDEYIAASSVGFGINASERADVISIDAEQMETTGRHAIASSVDEASTLLGLTKPKDQKGKKAFEENIGAFVDRKDTDKYVPKSEESDPATNLFRKHTGLFFRDGRGHIVGSNGNDLVWTTGVNDYSGFAKEHMPADRKPIQKDDPFYKNFFDGLGGNNIFIGGKGTNYAYGVTFAWIDGATSNDENYITTPDILPTSEDKRISKGSKNPKTLVHVTGSGKTNLYNPTEYDASLLTEEEIKRVKSQYNGDVDAAAKGIQANYVNDDWYEIEGSLVLANPGDEDKAPGTTETDETESFGDKTGFRNAFRTAFEDWENEQNKEPELDEATATVLSTQVGESEAALASEVNSFFDSMFSELDGLFAERGDPENPNNPGQGEE